MHSALHPAPAPASLRTCRPMRDSGSARRSLSGRDGPGAGGIVHAIDLALAIEDAEQPITGQEIERLAAKAEAGYYPATLIASRSRRGRPSLGSAPARGGVGPIGSRAPARTGRADAEGSPFRRSSAPYWAATWTPPDPRAAQPGGSAGRDPMVPAGHPGLTRAGGVRASSMAARGNRSGTADVVCPPRDSDRRSGAAPGNEKPGARRPRVD